MCCSGVARVDDAALSRVDLVREMRDHTDVSACREALDALLEDKSHLKISALKSKSSLVSQLEGSNPREGDVVSYVS